MIIWALIDGTIRQEFLNLLDFIRRNKEVLGTLATCTGAAFAVIPKLANRFLLYRDRRTLHTRLGAELYTAQEITSATSYYIQPDCQSIDPSGGEDFRKVYAVRQNAFDSLDKLFGSPTEHRHSLILADSGMGKSSLLLNYYARHWRRRDRPFKIAIFPLGRKGVDEKLTQLEDRSDTVLFLDAFDEDTLAIQDHHKRLRTLLDLTEGFYHVLITCRTQFFESDSEIPKETGLVRFGITAAGQDRQYMFYKLYLSPFSDNQVKAYLKRRFPFWKFRRRQRAFEIAAKMPDLTIRPMLLAHIQDLLNSSGTCRYAAEIYEAMIAAWLVREQAYVQDTRKLRTFCEFLAADIYINRKQRGSERIPQSDALLLASRLAIPLQGWQLRARSLLNRDAEGNLKFAHRTLMEYLFTLRFSTSPSRIARTDWTDQMKRFWWELVSLAWTAPDGTLNSDKSFLDRMPALQIQDEDKILSYLATADLSGLELLRLSPLLTLRPVPQKYSEKEALELVRKIANLNQTSLRWWKTFPGFFRQGSIPGAGVNDQHVSVIDHATGLMWANVSEKHGFPDAVSFISQLRRSKWAGYDDWRLPTFSEAISLLSTKSSIAPQSDLTKYPYNCFGNWSNELWVSDTDEAGLPLSIDLGVENIVRFGKAQACTRGVRSFA